MESDCAIFILRKSIIICEVVTKYMAGRGALAVVYLVLRLARHRAL